MVQKHKMQQSTQVVQVCISVYLHVCVYIYLYMYVFGAPSIVII